MQININDTIPPKTDWRGRKIMAPIKNSDIEKQIILNLPQSLNKTIPGLLTWNEIDCTQ